MSDRRGCFAFFPLVAQRSYLERCLIQNMVRPHQPMWIPRTPEEEAKWHASNAKSACSYGRIIGFSVWLLVSLLSAGGWFVSFRAGIAVRGGTGNFWLRLPVIAAIAFPFAYWVSRHESKRELQKHLSYTICPKCDIASRFNAGERCECGDAFVLQSTVKWVE